MMLQMSATPASPAIRAEPAPTPVPGKSSGPRPSWNNKQLQAFMTSEQEGYKPPELGALAPCRLEESFEKAPPGTVKAGSMLQLNDTMIVALSDVIIEETDHGGVVVTGTRGKNNECRLIFRRAYCHVRCDIRIPNGAAESRITYLRSPSAKAPGLAELHSFNICQPLQRMHGDTGGFSMTLDYHADPLNEVQGILWRGGLLQISRISLTP
jgi:hypothetical protein